jgi:hypothetical protein
MAKAKGEELKGKVSPKPDSTSKKDSAKREAGQDIRATVSTLLHAMEDVVQQMGKVRGVKCDRLCVGKVSRDHHTESCVVGVWSDRATRLH